MRIYVCAPYADAHLVRDVHDRMLGYGLESCSSWAMNARGPESFDPDAIEKGIRQNDADVTAADALLVLARPGVGGEMFCEVRLGLVLGKPVVWVGRRILSSYRPGVTLAEDTDDAIVKLLEMKRKR